MPNRILRDGINESEAVNSLSIEAEVFYRRLMSLVDDYGRCEAHPQLLLSRLFPLQTRRWSVSKIESAITECASTMLSDGEPLVLRYVVHTKPYLQINRFGQRTRSESKFPAPGEFTTRPKNLKEGKGRIYFAQSVDSKRIKIGYTEQSPEARIVALQTGSHERLTLLKSIPGTMKEERELQRRFITDCLSGEWFKPSDELLQFIATADTSEHQRDVADISEHQRAFAARATHTTTHTTPNTNGRMPDFPPMPDLVFDLHAGFREVWDAYPVKGRIRQSDSKGEYTSVMFAMPVESQVATQAKILNAIRGKWATSEKWKKGFVLKLSEWIKNLCWDEDPEQASESGALFAEQASTLYKPDWEQ